MTSAIFKMLWIFALLLLLNCIQQSNCIDYFDIVEDTNFLPCTVGNNTLLCDASTMASIFRNRTARFSRPNRQIIDKIQLLNFEIEDISANFFGALGPDLLSVRIVSKSTIKRINSQTFIDCKKITFLEIGGASNSEDFSLAFDNVLSPLSSLEELKLVNLNIWNLVESYFVSLTNLKSFTIDCPLLNSISPQSFRNNKLLFSLNFVNIKNSTDFIQTLENWPSTSKLSIKALMIKNCDIKKLPKFSENVVGSLSQLSLAKNPLVEIGLDATITLTKLEILSLVSTKLSRNNMSGLRLLTNLKELKLDDIVTLKDLPIEIESMTELESINFDMSKFDTISIALPASIKKISAAFLQTPIQISTNFLSRCSKLNTLHLIGLSVDSIQFLLDNVKVFGSSLTVLTLDDTSLMRNRLLEFVGSLRNLEILFLNRANIDIIPDSVLFNLVNLKQLMLSGNHLQYNAINSEGFQNVAAHLTNLDLSKNQLISLPPCMFYSFPNFDGLNLHGNSFICDCHMLWFHETLTRKNVSNPLLNFTCSSGPNDGKSFFKMSASQLNNCSLNTINNCTPSKKGFYKVEYSATVSLANSVLTIDITNGSGLKFLFDYFTVNIRQFNNTFHSDMDKFDLSRRNIDMSLPLKPTDIEVCLVLNRNKIEYTYDYNCRTLLTPKTVSESRLSMVAGVVAGLGAIVLIVVIVVVIYCRRWRRRKEIEKEHEYYEASSTEYSEPDDTYKSADQYAYVSDEHYSIEPDESFDSRFIPISNKLQKLPPIQSSSMDNGLDISKTSSSQPKNKFRKRPHIAELISKARSSSNLLERQRISLPNVGESISMSDLANRDSSTLPRQYLSRALPQTPSVINLEDDSQGFPPPKPRLSNANIQNLLNNADQHLNYFSQYISNNSLCTDESANHPHSGDSGLGVSKVSNNLNHSLSGGNSVII